MYSIRSVTNLFALENVSAGSLVLFGKDGKVLQVPGQNPDNPLFLIDASTGTVTVNGTFSNPSPAPTPISLGDGTVSAPSLAFASNSSTGLYRPNVNQLGLVAGGASPMIVGVLDVEFSDKHLLSVGSIISGGSSNQISLNNSSALTSSIKVSDQLITGIINAVDTFFIRATNTESVVPSYLFDGLVTAPAYSFTSQTDMGLYKGGVDDLRFATGGQSRLQITNASTLVMNALNTNPVIPTAPILSISTSSSGALFIQGNIMFMSTGSEMVVFNIEPQSTKILSTLSTAHPRSMLAYGRYLYLAESNIYVYDLQNPVSVVQVGSVENPGALVADMYAQGNRLYTASLSMSLAVFDITRTTPVLLGSIATTSSSQNVIVKDNVAFVMGDYTVSSYDVSNPASIVMLNSIALGGAGYAVISGNYIYTIDTSDESKRNINVINITNPSGLTIESFLSLSTIEPGSIYLEGLVVRGKYAFVGVRGKSCIYIIDIGNPASLSYFGRINTSADVEGISMEGNFLYVSTDDNTVYKYYLGGTTIDTLSVGSVNTDTLHVKTQALIENNLVILGGAYMQSLEVRGPLGASGIRYPTQDGTVGQAILTDGAGNLIFGNISASTAVLADGTNLAPSLSFLSDPDTGLFRAGENTIGMSTGGVAYGPILFAPELIDLDTRWITGVGCIEGVTNQDLQIKCGDNSSSMTLRTGINQPIKFNFGIITAVSIMPTSMTVPAIENQLGAVATPAYTFTGDTDTGVYSFAPNTWNVAAGGVDIIQAKSDDFRIYKSLFAFASVPATFLASVALTTTPTLMELQGDKAYVILGLNSIQVVDVSTPQAPILIGAPAATSANILCMYIYGRYLYTGVVGGFIIFDVLDPSALVQRSFKNLSSDVNGIFAAGNRLFTVSQDGNLYIHDISNVGAPFQLSVTTLPSVAINVIAQSKYVYTISHTEIRSFNISDPGTPLLLNTLAISGAGFSKVYGVYIFIADNRVGPPNNITIVNIADATNLFIHSATDIGQQVGDFGVGGKLMLITSKINPIIILLDITDKTAPAVLPPINLVAPSNGIGVSGKYMLAIGSNDTFYTYDIGGSRIDSAEVGVAKISTLTVDKSLFVQNNLSVEGGIYVSGGINIEGGVGLNGFTFPLTDGVAGQALVTNGAGKLLFEGSDANPIGVNSGTALNPGVYFTADTDVGIYLADSNTFGIATGTAVLNNPVLITPIIFGMERREVNGVSKITGHSSMSNFIIQDGLEKCWIALSGGSVEVFSSIKFNADFGQVAQVNPKRFEFNVPLYAQDGSQGAPSYTFNGASDTGMYRVADKIGFTIASVPTVEFDEASINVIPPGSAAAASLRWRSTEGLGLYSSSTTALGVSIGGVEQFAVDTTKGIITNMGVNRPTVSTASSEFTVDNTQFLIRLTLESNQAITLPLATTMPGRQIILFKKSNGGTATITPTSPDTIDGTLTSIALITQYDRIVLVSDGENSWITV